MGSGGAQRQLVELGKGFKARGHEVLFLTYHDITFFKPDLEAAHIPVKTVLEPNYLKRIFKIRKVIRQEKPNVVLSFLESSNFMATLAGFPNRKWKLIVGERSANPEILTSKKLRFYRKFHFFTDYVVSNSHKNLELVRKIIPTIKNEKLKVIYNSVNIPAMNYFSVSNQDKTHIVIAASYRTVKNLDGLIEAVYLLSAHYQSKLKIEWFGAISMDRKYYDINKQKIKKLKLEHIIQLNDKTNQVAEKIKMSDFVGLFSHYEGFPNAICEAMAMGKPVIVSKVSDIPLFIKEGINGFLCDSRSAESIKNALIKAIDSDAQQRLEMGENNYCIASGKFNKDVIVEQYLNLFIGG